jgi:energy-converting hydrogenase Eha subunit F
MDEYNILNTVKPAYFRSKFPYNIVSPAKIKFTMNKINIWVADDKKKHVGGNVERSSDGITPQITFYG